MSYRYGTSLVPGAYHYGGGGLGCPGSLIPSGGLDGPGYLFAGLDLPADAAKEVRGLITRWPAGTLTVWEDSSFRYVGPSDYALYELYVDGALSTLDIGYGSGIGRIQLAVGAVSEISGGVQMDDSRPGGELSGGVASVISGGVVMGDSRPGGVMTGSAPTSLQAGRRVVAMPDRTRLRRSVAVYPS